MLEGEIAEKQSELESIKPQFQEQVQQEEEHNQRYMYMYRGAPTAVGQCNVHICVCCVVV